MDKLLLILDLDETLIRSVEGRGEGRTGFDLSGYWVTPRPHLDMFLGRCQNAFDVAVWSAASESYAQAIIERLFPRPKELRFVWSNSRCSPQVHAASMDLYFRKDLRKVKDLGFKLERTLILDDIPATADRNYGNYVPIKPFKGDADDNELPRLWPWLERWSTASNVRTIEKRHWRWAPAWLTESGIPAPAHPKR